MTLALADLELSAADLKLLRWAELDFVAEVYTYSRNHLEDEFGLELVARLVADLQRLGAPRLESRPQVAKVLGDAHVPAVRTARPARQTELHPTG